jgi:predicted esterase YcpF (UPF0227 family)
MKILYLHGIGSGANSNTAKQLAAHFTEATVLAPELPVSPIEAFSFIKALQKREQPNIVVGTSLGGFYASYLHGPMKILINPAMRAADVINAVGFGAHKFFCERSNGAEFYVVNADFVNQLQEIEDIQKAFIDDELRVETFALFGVNDKVISNVGLFKDIYGEHRMKLIEAEHRLSNEEINTYLIPLVKELADRL